MLVTQGGKVNSGKVSSYKYGVGATLPTDVTRSGYTFTGWHDNSTSTFSDDRVTALKPADRGDKTFYARWRQKYIAVKFEPGGGTLPNGDNLRVVGQGLKYEQSVNFYGNHKDDFARFNDVSL